MQVLTKEGNLKKNNFSDLLYFCLICTLLLDRFSFVPSGLGGKLFAYQVISFLLVFLSFITHEKIYIPSRILISYLPIFIQSCLIVMIGRADLNIILRENIQLVFLLAMTIVVYNYSKNQPNRFLGFINLSYHIWIISSLLLLVLYLIVGIDFGINIDHYFPYPRLKGLSGDPNVLGIYILTFLPIVLYQNRRKKKYKLFLLIITTIVILATFSRANTIILLIFYLIYIVLGLISKNINKDEVFFIVLMFIMLLLIVLSSFSIRQAIVLRFQQFILDTNIYSDSRFGLWMKGLNIYRKNPILGIGIDHSTLYIKYFIHNTFIEWILSCGIFSLGVLGLYARYLVMHFIRCKKSRIHFYFCLAYLLHILALNCVSLLNFEPTFITFALSEAYFNMEHKMCDFPVEFE